MRSNQDPVELSLIATQHIGTRDFGMLPTSHCHPHPRSLWMRILHLCPKSLVRRVRRPDIQADSRCTHCVKSRSTLRHGRTSNSSSRPVDHRMLLIQAISERRQYFQLGVSEQTSLRVEVLTDSEPLVGSMLKRLGPPLTVKAAAPQAHESIGLAEKNVRTVKEMTSCIRSDMHLHGFDLSGSPESFNKIMQYVTQTHNHFGVGGSIGQ